MSGDAAAIRARVLRALALNREPGFHFIGNLAEVSYDAVAADETRVGFEPGSHVTDADGQANISVVAMLVDMALAASIRSGLHPATRLATVSLAMQFTGVRLEGRLESAAQLQGFQGAGATRLGLARARIRAPGGVAVVAQGAFMPLEPPPGVALFPLPRAPRVAPAIAEAQLSPEERKILARADATLARGEVDFLRRLLGYEPRRTKTGATCTMPNGMHAANRVGHMQGGVLVGLAASTAAAVLPSTWALSAISSFFVSPGQGKALRARAKPLHHGLTTAVLRTEVSGPGRRVLETTTAHVRR